MGKSLKYKSNRQGVAERFEDQSARKTVAVDLEVIASYDKLLGRQMLWNRQLEDRQQLFEVGVFRGSGPVFARDP